MSSYFTNVDPLTFHLHHVSQRLPQVSRPDTVTVEPGGAYCQADGVVVGFLLGLTGHHEAPAPGNPWHRQAVVETAAGGRLMYCLADLRRPGDTTEVVAGAFIHALAAFGLEALHRRAEGGPQLSASAKHFIGETKGRIREPIGDWLHERWKALRPHTPNGYLNLATRQPAWHGALSVAGTGATLVSVD